MADTIRELLFKQAQLYRGVTREQFEKDRPADALFPRDHVAAAIGAQNDAEKAEHDALFGRAPPKTEQPTYSEGCLTRRQAGGL